MSFTFGPAVAALFMVVFARVGTLVMLLPALGERFVPARVRLALAIFLTLGMMPLVQPLLPAGATTGTAVFTTLFLEIAIGLMIGLTGRLVVSTLQTAGNFVSQALGLSFAETVDPTQGGQSAAIGNLLTMLGVTLLFATDGHHLVIGAIGGSYVALPPAGAPPTGDAAMLALSTMGKGFGVAVQIAAPFIVFGVLINLGLGVLSRLMPALQVFFLGMPATIMIGFVILAAVIGMMMGLFLKEVSDFLVPLASR
ncbi:flagellar biosynthetic protein FliR [Alsobacter sp. KACC 23698]|uniref:Flagellar biosynthetic protein FliR n=1 Tax=Alsobacter sp. KACC 23698 TaxID=3149229 RepID=A0AAU7JA49_9HYPH